MWLVKMILSNKRYVCLGPRQTEKDKTELTNGIARKVKTDLSHLFETI
jgi:hypothetical protein